MPVGPMRIVVGLIEKGYRLMGIMGTRSRILANSGQAPSPIIPPVTKAIIDKSRRKATRKSGIATPKPDMDIIRERLKIAEKLSKEMRDE